MRRVWHARTLQQRLVVAGEQPLGITVVADREGAEVGLEEGAGLSRCGCLCTERQFPTVPARAPWPPTGLSTACLAHRAQPSLERRERCLGIVLGPARQVGEVDGGKLQDDSRRRGLGRLPFLGTGAEKYQARKEKRCAAHGVRQDDAPVSTSCQFGSRERVSRSKVHRSTTVSIWRDHPRRCRPRCLA